MIAYEYLILPIFTWIITGTTKFIINSIRTKSLAIKLVGDGGFPSTHTSLISSMTTFIGITEGFKSPIFGLAFTVLMIVVFDALGIRRRVGKHAEVLNEKLWNSENEIESNGKKRKLRENSGHTLFEVLGGLVIGFFIAVVYFYNFSD